MLVIRADLVDAMVAHARADHPDEACGVIAGPESQSSSARQPGRLPLIEARSTWSKLPITPLPSPYAPFPLTSAMYALIERPQIDPLSHHES